MTVPVPYNYTEGLVMMQCPHCQKTIDPYRDNAAPIVKVEPVELSYEEKQKLKERSALKVKHQEQNHNLRGIALAAGVPLAGFYFIGSHWEAMTSGMATCSVFMLIIATGAAFVAVGIKFEWF